MKGLLLFLLGAAVGSAAVALFTTPQGEELRIRIREFLREKGLIERDNVDELVEMIATEIENKK